MRVERLRVDIDEGRTADKVAGGDPATAPMGTDDEAAGDSPDGRRAGIARDAEMRNDIEDIEDSSDRRVDLGIWVVLVLLILAGLAFVLWLTA